MRPVGLPEGKCVEIERGRFDLSSILSIPWFYSDILIDLLAPSCHADDICQSGGEGKVASVTVDLVTLFKLAGPRL